jgi:hypothetical protein
MVKLKNVVTLDRERTLKYDYNALALTEKETGKNLLTDLSSLKALRITDLRALFWAGALHEDPELTLEAAGGLLKPSNTGAVLKAVVAGLNDFFGEKS